MSARDRILDAAVDIAATDGVLSLGVDNVNRRAGVSKGAFFYHFKSKDEMVMAMLDKVLQEFDVRIAARVAEGLPVLEVLVDLAIAEVRERGALIGSLVAAISIDPSLAERVIQSSRRWHEQACCQSGLGPQASMLLHLLLDGLFMSAVKKDTERTETEFHALRQVILTAVRSCSEDGVSSNGPGDAAPDAVSSS